MFITLLAWIYITWLCWAWGILVISFLKKFAGEPGYLFPHFIVVCLTGLAGITSFAGLLSLFIPLGGWLAQVLITAPSFLVLFIKRRPGIFSEIKSQFTSFRPAILFLIAAYSLLLLVMSSWRIIHPDTLAYHAQIIGWMEKYPAVPGLIHLQMRLGLQNYWFAACALFSFDFSGSMALTFINSTILLWFILFIAHKINLGLLETGKFFSAFLWLTLLVLSTWSYTQLRLTATSANPDFVAAIFVWLVFYLLVKKETPERPGMHFLLIIFLSVFAITIKISVIPILTIALYAGFILIRLKKYRSIILSFFITIIVLVPFFTRNIITSGYPVFPSVRADIANVDWKYEKEKTGLLKDYITGHARLTSSHSTEEITAAAGMRLEQWMPAWWRNLSLADKFILILFAVSILLSLFIIKDISRAGNHVQFALVGSIAGIVFWFVLAPDPRFGFGFIIGFPAIIASLVLHKLTFAKAGVQLKILLVTGIIITGFLISAYVIYRFNNFFSPEQVSKPMGTGNFSYGTIHCNGLEFRKPVDKAGCAGKEVPCVVDSCENFILRGNKISDGFRAK